MKQILMKRTLFFLIVVVCVTALPVIADEPTRITGPLTAEGYIDYLKALEERFYPPEMKTDDNGFRGFVRTFGDVEIEDHDYETPEKREFYRFQRYEKLGLDPDTLPTLTLPPTTDYVLMDFHRTQGDDVSNWERKHLGTHLWTLEEYPMLTDWIKEIDKPMDAIAEMIRKPVFFPPFLHSPESVETGIPQNFYDLHLPDVQLSRNIARIFYARAGYRIGQGNIDGAIDDALTLCRLGRLLPQGGSPVQYLVGMASESAGRATPVNANPEHPLTEQQIRRLLAGLDALPPRPPLMVAYEWERYSALGFVQSMRIGIDQKKAELDTRLYDNFPTVLINAMHSTLFNWDVLEHRMNEVYDAMQEPPPRARFKAIMEKVDTIRPGGWQILARTLMTHDGPERLIPDMIIALLTPALEAFEEAVWRAECMENLQRLVLAILLYQLEHGKIPDDNWAAQIEKYLGENAERYFSCPSNPSPKGQTTYALVQYGDALPTNPDTILLVELTDSVPLDKAVISVDEVLARQQMGGAHHGRMNVALRSGAVWVLSSSTDEKEWRRQLGREEESE